MKRQEVQQVMGILDSYFPSWLSKLSLVSKNNLIDVWCKLLEDQNPQLVINAVYAILKSSTHQFPPTVGIILTRVKDMTQQVELSEQEAWAAVKKALGNCIHNSVLEYQKLPKEIQLVVTPDMLYDWAILPTEELDTVVSSNFMRSYRSRIEAYRENQILDDGMKTLIGNVGDNLLKIETEKPPTFATNEIDVKENNDLRESPNCVMCGHLFTGRDLYILYNEERICLPCRLKLNEKENAT